MATNKERIISHNTRLQNISTEIDTLPTEESLKNGSYLWNKYLVDENGSINYKSVSYVISNDMNEYPQDGLLDGYYYEAFTVYPMCGYWNSSKFPSALYFKNVAGNDTVALAFGKSQNYSDSKGSLYYSEDGINWTVAISSTYGCDGLEYHNGTWVATTNKGIYYSLDGKTWTQAKSFSEVYTSGCYIVGYVNNIWFTKYYGVGDGSSYYSEDGKTWTELNVSLDKVFYNNGIWVGTNTYDSNTTIYYSYDGITWNIGFETTMDIDYINYNDNIWILSSYNSSYGVYYSTDGINWVQSNLTGGFTTVDYYNNIWNAYCTSGDLGIYYSTDGMTWTQSNITTGEDFEYTYLDRLRIISSTTSSIGMYYSTDGMTWTQSNITTGNYSIHKYNNILIAYSKSSSNSSVIYYSEDGMIWTESNMTTSYYSIFECDGVVLASNEAYKGVYYSVDGKTWNPTNMNTGKFTYCWYFKNTWLACSQAGSSSGGTIWYSYKEQLLS